MGPIVRRQRRISVAFIIVLFSLINSIDVIIARPSSDALSDDDSKVSEFFDLTTEAIDNDVNRIRNDEYEYRKRYADRMKTYMNESVEPCDDFYEYACGNWKNVIKERQSQHKRSNLLDIVYKLVDAVEKLLEKPTDQIEFAYSNEWKLAQKFYNSCLAADLYPMKKSEEYLKVIKSVGGFPAVDSTWSADSFSWFNMTAHLSNYGVAGLVREEIVPQHPFLPYFRLPELGFDYIVHSDNIATNDSRGYELNEKRMREYLTTYGVDETKITQVISDIFEFWHQVLNVTDKFDEDLDKCRELSESSEEKRFEKWNDYFSIAWMGTEFNMTEDDCPCNYFYVELDEICNEHKEAVANYLSLLFLYNMDARLKAEKFHKDHCIMTLQHSLPYIIDQLYLQEYFSSDIRNEIFSIIKQIRKSMRNVLEEADWLDESTRSEALQKEGNITIRVGNFEDPQMTDRLIRQMNNLTFTAGNYELNNLQLKKFKTFMKRFNGLHNNEINNDTKPLELLLGMQVNAFYYNIDNSITVMAGILHPPAYDKAWPNSLKFGTLGYLVGHEFTHGFDSVGSYYDAFGQERQWWSDKSYKVFDERANCYVNHYNDYLIPEINRKINGNQTKDENIADSGGLREALAAYRRHLKKLIKDSEEVSVLKSEQMPGLSLSPEQLLFLGFAQLWCASYKEEHYWEELTNEHTMDKYRVLGAVTNIEDFAKVYNCPLGSRMNPDKDKCRLW